MQTFAHVIAEQNEHAWSAWFTDEPQSVCEGDDWAQVLAILIDIHGSPKLEWQRIITVEEASREGHVEFLIPYFDAYGYPPAISMN